jgi:hypothetical protein
MTKGDISLCIQSTSTEDNIRQRLRSILLDKGDAESILSLIEKFVNFNARIELVLQQIQALKVFNLLQYYFTEREITKRDRNSKDGRCPTASCESVARRSGADR